MIRENDVTDVHLMVASQMPAESPIFILAEHTSEFQHSRLCLPQGE